MKSVQDLIIESCNEAIHDDPCEGVDLDEAGTQILQVKKLVESSMFQTVMSSALARLESVIENDYHGAEPSDEPHRLGFALGFSKEQIDNALVEGYLPSTDPLEEE